MILVRSYEPFGLPAWKITDAACASPLIPVRSALAGCRAFKPAAEFGPLFERVPGFGQPLLSDCEANTTRSTDPADSATDHRCIRWKTNIRIGAARSCCMRAAPKHNLMQP